MTELADIDARIRLGSIEVNIIDENLLQILKNMPNFCPHFHLSMQSGCDRILKLMNRHYTKQQFLEKVELIRKYFPNVALHASTQLAIHNSYGVKQAQQFGFKRVVLARELSLEQIKYPLEVVKTPSGEHKLYLLGKEIIGWWKPKKKKGDIQNEENESVT